MKLVKIRIPVNEGNICAEYVWAFQLKNGNYRIDNRPVNATWVKYRDIVKAVPIDGTLTFQRVVIMSDEPSSIG